MKKNIFLSAMICLVVTCFLSCKNDPVATPPRTDIHLDSTDALAGRHLVDKDGKTLYFFPTMPTGYQTAPVAVLLRGLPLARTRPLHLAMVWQQVILQK